MRLSIHLTENQRILIFMLVILFLFMFLGIVDWNVTGWKDPKTYDLIVVKDVPSYWAIYWGMGIPLYAVLVMAAYKLSPHSSNLVAFGLFMTVILLALGQLEDFFYFVLGARGHFPTGEWSWFTATIYWRIFGTWTTTIHFRWLTAFVLLTVVMWGIIFYHNRHR